MDLPAPSTEDSKAASHRVLTVRNPSGSHGSEVPTQRGAQEMGALVPGICGPRKPQTTAMELSSPCAAVPGRIYLPSLQGGCARASAPECGARRARLRRS